MGRSSLSTPVIGVVSTSSGAGAARWTKGLGGWKRTRSDYGLLAFRITAVHALSKINEACPIAFSVDLAQTGFNARPSTSLSYTRQSREPTIPAPSLSRARNASNCSQEAMILGISEFQVPGNGRALKK